MAKQVVHGEESRAAILRGVVFVLGADMFEIVEAAQNHFATRCGPVVLEHVQKSFEKKPEVGIGETRFLRERRRDVTFGDIEGIGDDVFVAHGAVVAAAA